MDPWRDQVTNTRAERLFRAMEEIRREHGEMPAQVLATLMYIASHKNCHKQALEDALKMTTASASRNTDWLSDSHRIPGKPGMGLIIKERDPGNLRRYQLKLSPKGERLMTSIMNILYD